VSLAVELHVDSKEAVPGWKDIAIPNALRDIVGLDGLSSAASNVPITDVQVPLLGWTASSSIELEVSHA